MKTPLRAATALALLALSTSALAQQSARAEPKLGLGVGITRSQNGPDLGTLLFVPINPAPNLRIEPFIGWTRSDVDAAPPGSGGSFFTPGAGKASDFTLGVGGFVVHPLATQVQLYAGGRLASQWQSFRNTGGTFRAERRNTLLAAAAGGEYLPVPRVAFGAELQVGYVWYGDTDFTNGVVSTSGGGGSGTATQGTLFARFYLF